VATLAVVLGLAGAVVIAHSVMGHDTMGDALAVCLAVAETAVLAVGVTLAVSAWIRRPLWLIASLPYSELALLSSLPGIRARAGPPLLQRFRL